MWHFGSVFLFSGRKGFPPWGAVFVLMGVFFKVGKGIFVKFCTDTQGKGRRFFFFFGN